MTDIYEHDLRESTIILDSLKNAMDNHNALLDDAYVLRMEVTIASGHGYTVGTLTYEDEQWRFTPYVEQDTT